MTRCGGSASTPGRIGDSAAHQAGASPSHVGTRQSGPRPIILPPGPCRCHSGAMPPAPLLSFAGHAFVPLAGRALFWPRHRALIVADLHLEKASWYAAAGQPLPPYDSHDTLDRLARLAGETGAEAVWRSEEHTSELQSLMRISYAVFCLKKKRNLHKSITVTSIIIKIT